MSGKVNEILSGTLSTKGVFGSWSSSHFVLRSDGILQRMKVSGASVRDEILLIGAIGSNGNGISSQTQVIDGQGLSGKSHTIAILRVGHTPIILLAKNSEIQQQWIRCLRNVVGGSTKGTSVSILLEAFNDPTIASDTKGIIIGYNSAAQRLFGYTRDEIIGKNVKVLMPDGYAVYHDRYLARYLASQEKKLIGCPRALIAVTKEKVQIPIILSLGEMESPTDAKYYIAMFKPHSSTPSLGAAQIPTPTSTSISVSPEATPGICPMGYGSMNPSGFMKMRESVSEHADSDHSGSMDDGEIHTMGPDFDDAILGLRSKWGQMQAMIDTLTEENRRLQEELSRAQAQITSMNDTINSASPTSARFQCTQLLNHDLCYPMFQEYCRTKSCEEMCMFYRDVQFYRKKHRETMNLSEMKNDAQWIQQKFLQTTSAYEINMPSEVRSVLDSNISSGKITISLFDAIANDVLTTLHTNHYENFIRTGSGKACLAYLSS